MRLRVSKIFLLLGIYMPLLFEAQVNLVPNPSFEVNDTCPNSTGQLSYTINWKWVGSSTDYYNSCSPQGNMSVPANIYGYQNAAQGNAYIGMNTFVLHEGPPYTVREPAGTYLTQPLTIGQKYFLSFKVVMTLNNFESCCATNKIGALLSTNAFTSINGNNPAPVKNFAHVYADSIISDTASWTTISGSIVADSMYSFISIGNFFDSLQTQYIDYNGLYGSYYYVDDVRLSTDSIYGLGIVENSQENKIKIYPNPSEGALYIKLPLDGPYDLSITNALGELLFHQRLEGRLTTLNIGVLKNGSYMIFLKSRNHVHQERIILNTK